MYQHVIATQHHQKIFKKIKRVVIIPNRRMKKTIQTPRSNNKIKRQKLSPKPVLNKKYKRKRITMQTQIQKIPIEKYLINQHTKVKV